MLKKKQLKLPEGHKIPTAQEMNGRPYCKWHHSFTHITNDCKELRRQIQTAIEQGRLILGQFAMKVDTQPFPSVNMVEHNHSTRRQLDFSFDVNMAGPVYHRGRDKKGIDHSRGKEKEEAGPRDRPRYDDRRYITEEQVRSVRYQRPLSAHLAGGTTGKTKKIVGLIIGNTVGMIGTTKDMSTTQRGGQESGRTWIGTGIVLSLGTTGIQE